MVVVREKKTRPAAGVKSVSGRGESAGLAAGVEAGFDGRDDSRREFAEHLHRLAPERLFE